MKTALVLGGGGARGSYQIGVWKALTELDIEINIVTGTSVGALNAALISINDFENAKRLWENIETSMVIDVELDENQTVNEKIKTILKQYFADYAKKGGIDAYPLRALINQYVDETVLRNSPIKCGIVTFDKTSLKPIEIFIDDIENGKIGDYLLASSSLFPAMKSCNVDGCELIDGGYYDNLPINFALTQTPDRVIAVDLQTIGLIKKPNRQKIKDLKTIKSYWDLGPILIFENDIINKNIIYGYLDTMKAFGVYDGIAFTFIKNEFAMFIRANRQKIKTLNNHLGLKFNKSKTAIEDLFHINISNHLKRKYKTEIDSKYITFFQSCVESAAEIFGIDETKIYSVSKLKKRLLEKVNIIEVPFISNTEINTHTKFKNAFGLLDKKVRTVYLASIFQKTFFTSTANPKIDTVLRSLFLPDEFLAAYFLSLID